MSIRKLTKAQVQPIIDRIADQLPGWKAEIMTRAGQAIMVKAVPTSMVKAIENQKRILVERKERG